MTPRPRKNLPASVRQRLLDKAKAENRPFAELLQHFAMERFLYRLSRSAHRERFILKGALMLQAWRAPKFRPTMDIDLLGRTSNEEARILAQVRDIMDTGVEPDGLDFDPGSLKAERIQAMRRVPGVGEVVATTFAAEVFRPERFNNSREVTAYLGLAPVVRQSGERDAKGRLRPVGQRRLRSLLVEAAWVWKQRDEQAREFYNRILGRHGVPQKAISALARKLAERLWRLSLPSAAA